MYYNCGGACAVCNVTYLHWNEVTQKREIAPGVWMPSVGFGTAGLGDYTRDVVVAAIRAGYRGVDSAEVRRRYCCPRPLRAAGTCANHHHARPPLCCRWCRAQWCTGARMVS